MFDKFDTLADFYKTLGDETRLRILFELEGSEKCVCDISDSLGMTQSAVSHQLKVLKMNRLVKSRKVGKHVFYSFDDNHVKEIFEMGIMHLMHK